MHDMGSFCSCGWYKVRVVKEKKAASVILLLVLFRVQVLASGSGQVVPRASTSPTHAYIVM
jgi:hypothetical protein